MKQERVTEEFPSLAFCRGVQKKTGIPTRNCSVNLRIGEDRKHMVAFLRSLINDAEIARSSSIEKVA
jgi:hypothetical protein